MSEFYLSLFFCLCCYRQGAEQCGPQRDLEPGGGPEVRVRRRRDVKAYRQVEYISAVAQSSYTATIFKPTSSNTSDRLRVGGFGLEIWNIGEDMIF
jgi:hypothetical protein